MSQPAMIRWSIGLKTVNIAPAEGDERASDFTATKEADDYLISASETADRLSRVTFAA